MTRECGYVVYRKGDSFVNGPLTCGDARSVTLAHKSALGQAVGSVHSHPSGRLELSDKDKEAGEKMGLDFMCVANADFTEKRCFVREP